MKRLCFSCVLIFLLLVSPPQKILAQERFEPTKALDENFVIDGLLNESVWEKATLVTIENEISPGNNTPARVKTRGLISYSDTHLYVGFHALDKPENIRASIRPRDNFSLWSDDVVLIRLDPYADGRNNYIIVVNPLGSHFDVRSVNAIEEDDRYDISFNMEFETAGQLVADGYQVEIKIPFSSL